MADDLDRLPSESARHRRPARPPAPQAAAWGPEACLHDLVAECAAGAPSRVALSVRDADVSYGELHRRAVALARDLRALGVGPECLVGLCLERSVEMIVAILGVLEAGGAYLPLDPDHPEERLRFMWSDSRRIGARGAASVLVGSASLAGRLRPLAHRFRELGRSLAAAGFPGPVLALRASGLEEGEEPLESVEAMARRYLREIRHVRPKGPYHLAGSSMGGKVAPEIARLLGDEGEAVSRAG